MDDFDGDSSPHFGAARHSGSISGDIEPQTPDVFECHDAHGNGKKGELPAVLQGRPNHSVHCERTTGSGPSGQCFSYSYPLCRRTSSDSNASPRNENSFVSEEASPLGGPDEHEEPTCTQRFLCPTFSCAVSSVGSNNFGIDQVTDPRTDSSAGTPPPSYGNRNGRDIQSSFSSQNSQHPISRGSSASRLTPASALSNTESEDRNVAPLAEGEEGVLFGIVGGSDPEKPYPCIVLRSAIEAMSTGTSLSLGNDSGEGPSSGASICEPSSASKGAGHGTVDTVTETFPFQDHSKGPCPSGIFEAEQEGYAGDACPDQTGRSLQIFPESMSDYDAWELHRMHANTRIVSNRVMDARPQNDVVSQEVQTRLPARGLNKSVQTRTATADVRTQTKRAGRCQRGVQCDMTRKIASFAHEELVNQHSQVVRHLESKVSTVRMLNERLQDEQRQKEVGLQRLEEIQLFVEELQGLLRKTTRTLSSVRAELAEEKKRSERRTAEEQAYSRAQQSEKESTDREHQLLVCALQTQLKHARAQLEQAEEERQLEVSREVRKTVAAKQHAQELDQQYTAQLRLLQARYEEDSEAIKQAQEEILTLRKELRDKESQHARVLHDTERQKDAECAHVEATQKANALSIKKELMDRSLEVDRLRATLASLGERLNRVHHEHLLEVQVLERSHQAKIQQTLLEHKRALDSHKRYAQQLREMAAMGKEDFASGLETQRQCWEDRTARLRSEVEHARARDRQSAKTIAELKASAESYKALAGELQSDLRDKIATAHHREAELAILRCEREDLQQTLQASVAEYQTFREEAKIMKNKLLSAIDDKEEALALAEARLADEFTVLHVDVAEPITRERCTHGKRKAARRRHMVPIS
ncbi:hypothetical protein NCLIV_051060, partial [Neospora caninum Liverpool]